MRHRLVTKRQERLDLLLATAGHDIRGPLGGIKVAASILASDTYILRPEESRALAADITDEVDRLATLIDSLLDVQRLHAERLNIADEPVHVADAIGASISRIRSISNRVLVAIDPELTLIGVDAFLLQSVVANLIGNALAVSAEDEVVEVQAHGGPDGLRITVADHGPGIALGDRERVFRPFECTATANSGSGLGLALVARFVEAMNGRVIVSDTRGGGTTIVVLLPTSESARESWRLLPLREWSNAKDHPILPGGP
jgi:two-component system, OmpR family, sensor histidine kinase KdpD